MTRRLTRTLSAPIDDLPGSTMPIGWLSLIMIFFLTVHCPAQQPQRNDGKSWTSLHGDLQRSGFYPQFPKGPLKVVWRKELHQELTGTRAEVIIGGGKAYLGTYAGNMYAWDAHLGQRQWVYHTRGPIMHSPMYDAGILYFASMDRRVYALDAQTGKEKWTFEADEGFWTSPTVFKQVVMIGARDGVFYALNARTGQLLWRHQTGDKILNTASITSDGKHVIFASEDMHVYCLRIADGKQVWKSQKMHGLSVRDHFPVIVGGVAILTTNPVHGFHDILNHHQNMMLKWAGFDDQREIVGKAKRYIPYSKEGVESEQTKFIAFLKANPTHQTFYAFNLSDGKQPWIAPIAYTAGLHNPPTPPCYNPKTNETYVYTRSAYGVWDGGGEVRPYSGVGKLDFKTGRVALLIHSHKSKDSKRGAGRKDMPWGSFWTIGDETQTLSLSADDLFSNHQGSIGAVNFVSGKTRNVYGKRDTYGGFYGPGAFGWGKEGRARAKAAGKPFGIVNEWHGPGKPIASVADGKVYYHVGAQVICLEGQ